MEGDPSVIPVKDKLEPLENEVGTIARSVQEQITRYGAVADRLIAKHQLHSRSQQPYNCHGIFFPEGDVLRAAELGQLIPEHCSLGDWEEFIRNKQVLLGPIAVGKNLLGPYRRCTGSILELDAQAVGETGQHVIGLLTEKTHRDIDLIERNIYGLITPFCYELFERLAEFLGISLDDLKEYFSKGS